MNLTTSRSWPHPVLSPLNDDISPNDFDFDLTVWAEYPSWHLKVTAKFNDDAIGGWIRNQKAAYLLQLECRRSYFRAGFTHSDKEFELTVPGDQLFGAVDASFMIVASADIEAYQHPLQHSDYGDASFGLGVGEPLAVAVTKRFDAYLEPDPILKISSIFDIRKNNQLHMVKIDCEGQRILIELPSADYDRYLKLRSSDEVRNLVASTVLLPALLHSFHFLARIQEAEEFDTFRSDHRWARCVLPKLQTMGIDLRSGGDTSAENCFSAAQKLLHGPLGRCFGELEEIFEGDGRQ